jgi:hypothetical protein
MDIALLLSPVDSNVSSSSQAADALTIGSDSLNTPTSSRSIHSLAIDAAESPTFSCPRNADALTEPNTPTSPSPDTVECTNCHRKDIRAFRLRAHQESFHCVDEQDFKIIYVLAVRGCKSYEAPTDCLRRFDEKSGCEKRSYKDIQINPTKRLEYEAWLRWLGQLPHLSDVLTALDEFFGIDKRIPEVPPPYAYATSHRARDRDQEDHTAIIEQDDAGVIEYDHAEIMKGDYIDDTHVTKQHNRSHVQAEHPNVYCKDIGCNYSSRGKNRYKLLEKHVQKKHSQLDDSSGNLVPSSSRRKRRRRADFCN